MYKGIGGSSGYGIGKIVIIKNDMPVYEINVFYMQLINLLKKQQKWLNI